MKKYIIALFILVGCKNHTNPLPHIDPPGHEHAVLDSNGNAIIYGVSGFYPRKHKIRDTCLCYLSQFGEKVNGSYPYHVMQDAINYSYSHGGGMICDTDALPKRDDSLNKEIYFHPNADYIYPDSVPYVYRDWWQAPTPANWDHKHSIGEVFVTDPPTYKCEYCRQEYSVYDYLPNGSNLYTYFRLEDSLRKKKIDIRPFLLSKWNERGSCKGNPKK